MEDLGVRVLHSDVQYAPVKLKDASMWLPTTATIEVETPRQHWRNVHRFTNYRRFSVTTTDTRGPQP